MLYQTDTCNPSQGRSVERPLSNQQDVVYCINALPHCGFNGDGRTSRASLHFVTRQVHPIRASLQRVTRVALIQQDTLPHTHVARVKLRILYLAGKLMPS